MNGRLWLRKYESRKGKWPMRRLTESLGPVRDRVFGYMQENVVFVHLPKCAGTSVRAAIERYYPKTRVTKLSSAGSKHCADYLGMNMLAYRRGLLIYQLQRGGKCRFLTGHHPVSSEVLDRWGGKWRFVTLLRDPVDRFISQYFYNLDSDSPWVVNHSLEEHVQRERATGGGTMYLHYLGDFFREEMNDPEEAVTEACRTLDRMDIVGTLEDLPRFVNAFETKFGKQLRVGVENRNEARQSIRRDQVTPGLLRQVEDLCRHERTVYEHVKELSET